MGRKVMHHTSCILSVVSVVLLFSGAGLLFLILRGDIKHDLESEEISGCTNVPPESHQVLSEEPAPIDCYPPTEREAYHDFRLPRYIVPVHYDLFLHPYPGRGTFNGEVNITVEVGRKTRYFIVHTLDLVIKVSSVVDMQNGKEVEIEKIFQFPVNDYHVVETVNKVEPGKYCLQFQFHGKLGRLVGFYESFYENSKNETRYIATSKFQPTHARRAFPCFDEPSFKSSFSISLAHTTDKIALSNMPAYATEPYEYGEQITKFQKTVPMVTYLAIFIVCDFEYKEVITSTGKPFRVYAQPDRINTTDYALELGSQILEYYEKYFGVEFSLPKLDMIGLPHYISAATEHWGLITYRDGNIYYDAAVDDSFKKQRITEVISHELSHMWFGNLVTCDWWDDTWLHESFASYLEYKGIEDQHPDWDIFTQFVTADLQQAMEQDNHGKSNPIIHTINSTQDIRGAFGKMTYSKGSSVLRMLETTVGKEDFRTGLSNFLKKHEFQNVKTPDLYKELSSAIGELDNRNISSIFKTWTEHNGFPYVTIMRESRNSPIFIAKQTQFLTYEALQNQPSNSSEKAIWSIPLSYKTRNNEFRIRWIHEEETKFELPLANTASDWIKFNVNETGYYMVNYDKEDWEKLISLLFTDHEALSPSDRSNLLYDSFHLAESRIIGFDVFFSICRYLKKERHLTPWRTVRPLFERLPNLLSENYHFLLDNYIRDLTTEPFRELGFSVSDDHLKNMVSDSITRLACQFGNEECLSHAVESFENWTRGQDMPKEFRFVLLKYALQSSGNDQHWEYLWNLQQKPTSLRDEDFRYLAYTRKPYLINRFIFYSLDPSKVGDFFDVLYELEDNPIGRTLIWQLLNGQFTQLLERFPRSSLESHAKHIARHFNTDAQLQEFKAFFAKNTEVPQEELQSVIYSIQNATNRIATYSTEIQTWLEAQSTCSLHHHRLPTHVVPEHYDLLLYPMLDQDRFNGSVGITVALHRPTDCFLLHSVGLNVTKTEVTAIDAVEAIEVSDVFEHKENNYLVVKVKDMLPVGRYRLYFEFEGLLTLSLNGLYKSSYLDPDTNEMRYLATTQFQSVDARKAFPCFDEPRFKSTFRVSVIHSSDYIALSNSMVENKSDLPDGLRLTTFQNTFPMVTYLLAVVVCDFKFRETITENGIRLRVYTAPHHIQKTYYSLEAGSKILTFYENYFSIPFPLRKLDLIAIPDFLMGGMENWGLITFDEEGLISSNATSVSVAQRQTMSRIIAHEMAHMWFGDLVTMKWWNDIWLNEGFATYISHKGKQHVEPGMEQDDVGLTQRLITAMKSDRVVNSRPIITDGSSRIFESAIFDTITYSKGCSVLRMLENYMREDFREGVSSYLKKHSFGSTETTDLWKELTAVSTQDLNVSILMDTWTRQMNYPFISIERNSSDEHRYLLQQHRFLIDPDTRLLSEHSPYNYTWQIPLTYRTSENPGIKYLFLNTSEQVELLLPTSKWIKFNADFTGIYLVNYDRKDWMTFIDILEKNPTVFSPSDRMNLLFDAFSLASAGHLEYDVPLNMTRYLRNEEHYGVWRLVLDQLYRIGRFFKHDPEIKEILKEHIKSLSKDLFAKFKWNVTGDYSERKLKISVIDASCKNGNEDCLETASYLFKYWTKGLELGDEIKELVLKYGLKTSSDEEPWDFVWDQYLKESNPSKKNAYLSVLPTVQNSVFLRRLIDYALNDTLVRKHSSLYVLKSIARNPEGLPLIMDLIFFNYTQLIERFGSLKIIEFTGDVFTQHSTERDLDLVEDWYTKIMKTKEGDKYRAESIEIILKNINWIKRNKNGVQTWLQNNVFMPWKNIRLPKHILPIKYNLTIHPNITELSFKGEVEIQLNVTMNTDYIILHQRELNILDAELRSLANGGDTVAIEESFKYNINEFFVIRLRTDIDRGLYAVKLLFKGSILNRGDGIGRYKYTHRVTNETRYLIATQFEPTFARKAFPCFDEPAMKTKIHLSVVHDSFHRTVSNMPEERKEVLQNGLVKTAFTETITMSTYLLFFSVSDFAYVEADYRGITVRAYAPPDRFREAEHGLNLTVKILENLERMFDIPYPLPKLDSIVIPHFSAPAMENWGAIAYRVTHFLTNDHMSKKDRVLDVDRTIAHELVHQWFGNLVTMKWWNDLWLNEGFATFVTYFPLRKFYPSIEKVSVRMMTKIMCDDSRSSSHPIVANVTTPYEIEHSFDSISYDKGGAVLKMLQQTLQEDFRLGISNYLKKYAYKNAETKDLWKEMTDAVTTDIDVAKVMNTWTSQFGFPFVNIERKGRNISATQHWFTRNMNLSEVKMAMNASRSASQTFIWSIPLTYRNIETKEEQTLWFKKENETFTIEDAEEDLIKFNPDSVGFYVVNYDEREWAKLGRRLQQNHLDFSEEDRYNLLHDAFLMAETDRLPYEIPLQLTKYMAGEKSSLPWKLFRDQYLNLMRHLSEETGELLKAYVAQLTEGSYDAYSSEIQTKNYFKKKKTGFISCTFTYPDLDKISIIVDLACQTSNEKCLEVMDQELQLWLNGHNITSDPQLVLDLAIPRVQNDTVWEILHKELISNESSESRRPLLVKGLTSFTDPTLVKRTIEEVMMNLQTSFATVHSIYLDLTRNPQTVPHLWEYAKNNWAKLVHRFGMMEMHPQDLVEVFCRSIKTTELLEEIMSFMEEIPHFKAYTINSCRKRIEEQINWSLKYEESIATWLTWNGNLQGCSAPASNL